MRIKGILIFVVGLVVGVLSTLAAQPGGKVALGNERELTARSAAAWGESKKEIVAAYEESVNWVSATLSNKEIRNARRAEMVAAIEVAGILRSPKAVPYLLDLLLYGRERDYEDQTSIGRIGPSPESIPAVEALIRIGIPSVEAACRLLAGFSEDTVNVQTLRRHCVWIIWKVLGGDLGREYLEVYQKSHPEAKKSIAVVLDFVGFKKP